VKKLVAVVIALFAAWLFATPYLTLRSIHSAAKNKDVAALSQYVDFPALKESLKTSLRSKIAQTLSKAHSDNPYGNILGAAGSRLALQLVDPLLDAALTPEIITELLQGQGRASSASAANHADRPLSVIFPDKEIAVSRGYESFGRFAVTLREKDSGKEIATFILTRQGLFSWKVSGVNLPG
jgi:hypothetical protein